MITRIILILSVLLQSAAYQLFGQPWEFAKESGGIKVYTRNEKNSSLKSYKGEMVIHAPLQKVCSMVGSDRNFDWWGPDFKNIQLLAYKKDKYVWYYYIYDMPWPITDRDLAVNATVKRDTISGEYSVTSTPLLKVIPEKPDLVRIKKYWQKWTFKPLDKGNVQIYLEGFVDPGGNVPSWIYNMLVTEMPLRTMGLLRERVLSDKPAN
jgi:hypothetical protein